MTKRRNLIAFLLDRTGSMGSIWEETINGLNVFIDDQLAQDYKTVWDLTVFDSQSIDLIRDGVKGKDMTKLGANEVFPRGSTPLFDAIAKTIHSADQKKGDFDGVILVIVTDGEENASREHSLEDIRTLISAKEALGWQVLFLGANMDAMSTARQMGVMAGATIGWAATADSVMASYRSASNTVSSYGNTGQVLASHTDTRDGSEKDVDAK